MDLYRTAIALLTATALAACGEGGDPEAPGSGGTGGTESGAGGTGGAGPVAAPVCGEAFTACGGDPTGAWRFDQSCGSIADTYDLADPAGCHGLPRVRSFQLDGTLTLGADGVAVEDVSYLATWTFEVPPACLSGLGSNYPPASVCVGLTRSFESQGAGGGCEWRDDERCACAIELADDARNEFTWAVDGGTLTFDGDIRFEYCVQDGYLVRRQEGADGSMTAVLAPDDGAGGTGGTGGTGGEQVPVCDEGFTPCGGNPIGTWGYDQICGAEPVTIGLVDELPECSLFEAYVRWDRLEGEVRFQANGAYVATRDFDYSIVFELPVACMAALYPDYGPEEVCPAVGEQLVQPDRGEHGGCTWDGQCRCELGFVGTETDTFTWSTDGGMLAIERPQGVEVLDYCVGDEYLVHRREGFDDPFVTVLKRAP